MAKKRSTTKKKKKAPSRAQKASQARFKKMVKKAKALRKKNPKISWQTAMKRAAK